MNERRGYHPRGPFCPCMGRLRRLGICIKQSNGLKAELLRCSDPTCRRRFWIVPQAPRFVEVLDHETDPTRVLLEAVAADGASSKRGG